MKFFSVVAGDEGLSPLHCEDNLDVDLGKCIRQLVAPLVSDSGRINGLGQILVQDVLPCTPFWRMVVASTSYVRSTSTRYVRFQ